MKTPISILRLPLVDEGARLGLMTEPVGLRKRDAPLMRGCATSALNSALSPRLHGGVPIASETSRNPPPPLRWGVVLKAL